MFKKIRFCIIVLSFSIIILFINEASSLFRDNEKETTNKNKTELYKESVDSIFAVYKDKIADQSLVLGTGFLLQVNEKDYVITNHHVANLMEHTYYLVNKKGKVYEAEIVYYSESIDISVLKFRENTKIPPLNIAKGNVGDNDIGEEVYTIGHPYDLLFTFGKGTLSNINKNIKFKDEKQTEMLLQSTIEVNPGNSGGPLLNSEGNVIGVVSSSLKEARGVSFAVPIEKVSELISRK